MKRVICIYKALIIGELFMVNTITNSILERLKNPIRQVIPKKIRFYGLVDILKLSASPKDQRYNGSLPRICN